MVHGFWAITAQIFQQIRSNTGLTHFQADLAQSINLFQEV